jgi:hypothetical protein
VNSIASMPAVRRIDTTRDNLFAIDVVGHVNAADAENLFGLMEAAYLLHPRLDVLVRLVDHDGVDWAEVSRETLEQGTAHALEHIARCATIGKHDWTSVAKRLLPSSATTEFRHFDAEDEAAAWQWLEAEPVPA